MIAGQLATFLLLPAARDLRRWLLRLGGIGLIPLGLLDSSFIPLPGSMDVATILLSARQQQLWLYYAVMATVGSVMGGFVTYRLAKKGGKEALERKFPGKKVESVRHTFEKWGFGSIAIAALMPPPIPMVPFVFAAGAMQYPAKKFLAALTLGRAVRYLILAYLADRYARPILRFIGEYGHPGLLAIVAAILCIAGIIFYVWRTKIKKNHLSKAHDRAA
jgi:membrane protein YqaA with SNARE-associated domain